MVIKSRLWFYFEKIVIFLPYRAPLNQPVDRGRLVDLLRLSLSIPKIIWVFEYMCVVTASVCLCVTMVQPSRRSLLPKRHTRGRWTAIEKPWVVSFNMSHITSWANLSSRSVGSLFITFFVCRTASEKHWIIWSICFGEQEASADNLTPGKNILNDEEWSNLHQRSKKLTVMVARQQLLLFWLRPLAVENYILYV